MIPGSLNPKLFLVTGLLALIMVSGCTGGGGGSMFGPSPETEGGPQLPISERNQNLIGKSQSVQEGSSSFEVEVTDLQKRENLSISSMDYPNVTQITAEDTKFLVLNFTVRNTGEDYLLVYYPLAYDQIGNQHHNIISVSSQGKTFYINEIPVMDEKTTNSSLIPPRAVTERKAVYRVEDFTDLTLLEFKAAAKPAPDERFNRRMNLLLENPGP